MANGLINLQTDLKSLRYGSETPYVTKDINNPPSSDKIGMQASKRIDDTSRIVQMLVSKPGLKYLANEALLKQASNLSKAEKAKRAKKSIAGAILSQIGGTFVGTVKIVGSTLAQVPVNGTGTHFLKGFRTDTYLQPGASPDKPGGPSAFARFFGAGGVEGAQYALRGEIVPGTVEVDNQNFVQTSRTGRELELIPSQYSYDARVLEDRNETKNTPLKGQLNSSLASDGKIISIKTSELRPIIGKNADTNELTVLGGLNIPGDNLVGVETTPTRGILTKQNLINSIPHTGSIAGDVNPDSSTNVASASYSYNNTYTKREAKTSINNAQNGGPIPVYPPGSALRETSEYLVGSQPTTDTEWLQGDVDNLNSGTQLYNGFNTYTGKTTEENIGNALGDSPIPVMPPESGIYESTKTVPDSSTYSEDKTYSSSRPLIVVKSRRVRLGDQGFLGIPNTDFQKAKRANSYWITDPDQIGVDIINTLEPSETPFDALGTDFAKFYFEIITPDGSQFLHFRAFIESIDDGYTADWQGRKYNGRAENFYTYGGFDRDINISFNVAAASRSELMPMYRKMIYLASATAPTYGDSGLMRGTVARLTIGSYFSHIPGVITSVKYNLDQNAPWEIQLGRGVNDHDDDVQSLPMMLKCSISFKPIHDFAPQTGLYPYFTELPIPAQDRTPIKEDNKKKQIIPEVIPQPTPFPTATTGWSGGKEEKKKLQVPTVSPKPEPSTGFVGGFGGGGFSGGGSGGSF